MLLQFRCNQNNYHHIPDNFELSVIKPSSHNNKIFLFSFYLLKTKFENSIRGQKFDVLFGDELVTGVVLAGRKHNIPTTSQYIGPLMTTVENQPPFLERSELARENAEVSQCLSFE